MPAHVAGRNSGPALLTTGVDAQPRAGQLAGRWLPLHHRGTRQPGENGNQTQLPPGARIGEDGGRSGGRGEVQQAGEGGACGDSNLTAVSEHGVQGSSSQTNIRKVSELSTGMLELELHRHRA